MAAELIIAAEIYAAIGLVVAVAFLFWGVDRFDENARGAFVFRPLLIPGVVLLWPLVLWRWRVLASGREAVPARHRPPRRRQDLAATALALAIPVILFTALLLRQNGPYERPAVLLEPPSVDAENTGETTQ